MAIVYVTDKEHRADVKVCEVKDYKADLLYAEVSADYKAKGDALWFFTDKEHKATVKIFWTDKDYKADILVANVGKDYKAKWQKSHKFQNRLS